MLRRLIPPAVFFAFSLEAAILPDEFQGASKRTTKAIETAAADRALWDEYGLEESESGEYEGAAKFGIRAWRLKDPTSALAVFQWLKPVDGRPSKTAPLAAESATGILASFGNYVLRFEGVKPSTEEFAAIVNRLPRLDQSSLPSFPSFMPSQGLIPNSERYVLGPATLERFIPQVTPSLAAFHLGAEAQMARYRGQQGDLVLALFYYPTPQVARLRTEEFHRLPSLMARRSGPLVAVVVQPPNTDDAERLLALVRYQATITWNEATKARPSDDVAGLLLGIFGLTGVIVLLCLAAGMVVAGLFFLRRRSAKYGQDGVIVLRLSGR